jgi:hypothetical protein
MCGEWIKRKEGKYKKEKEKRKKYEKRKNKKSEKKEGHYGYDTTRRSCFAEHFIKTASASPENLLHQYSRSWSCHSHSRSSTKRTLYVNMPCNHQACTHCPLLGAKLLATVLVCSVAKPARKFVVGAHYPKITKG